MMINFQFYATIVAAFMGGFLCGMAYVICRLCYKATKDWSDNE